MENLNLDNLSVKIHITGTSDGDWTGNVVFPDGEEKTFRSVMEMMEIIKAAAFQKHPSNH